MELMGDTGFLKREMHLSRLNWLLAFVLAFASAFGGVAHAQDPVKWSAVVQTKDVRAGEMARVDFTAKIEEPWHIYSPTTPDGGPIATEIKIEPGAKATLGGKAAQPKPIRKMDEGFGIETETFEKEVTFGVPVKLAADAKGTVKGTLTAFYQACNAKTCLPPKTKKVAFEIKVAEGEVRPDRQKLALASAGADGSGPSVSGTTASASSDSPVNIQKGNGSILGFLATAFGAGLLALLTPCVFPMIPITVSLFTPKNGEKKSLAGPIVYCAGIIGTFTLVGVLVSVVFGAAGLNLFAANPYVNLALATLFIVLAMNLFGAFEIIVPASVLNRVQPRGKSGLLAPFLMGLAFTLTSFTCTVPFVGTTLTAAATQGAWLPTLGMLAFSTAFALPFFLLSLFPSVLSKMPRAGEWLISVKAFMGFLELAAALKFLQTADQSLNLGLITRPVFLAIWFTLAVVAGLYLLRVIHLTKDSPDQKIGPMRKGFGLVTLGVAAWILSAFNGGSLHDLNAYLPPRDYGQKSEVKSQWVKNDLEGAMALAKSQNKPLLINFTGNACTNCRLMENDVLPSQPVTSQLGDFVAVELITDGTDAKSRSFSAFQQKKFGTIAIPLYAVMTPDGKIKGQLAGLERDPDKFADFLRQSHSQVRVASTN